MSELPNPSRRGALALCVRLTFAALWLLGTAGCGTAPGAQTEPDAALDLANDAVANADGTADSGAQKVDSSADPDGAADGDSSPGDVQPVDSADVPNTPDAETDAAGTEDAQTDVALGVDASSSSDDAEADAAADTAAIDTPDAATQDVDDGAADSSGAQADAADAMADAEDAVTDVSLGGDDATDSGAPADVIDSLDEADVGPPVDVTSAMQPAGLASLSVQGAAFVAPFAPDVHDYAVYCTAGPNAWTVLASAETDATATIISPQAEAFDGAGMATLTVLENDAVVVRATATDGTTADYWLRCLPPDFPHGAFVDAQPTAPGYYVLGNTALGKGSSGYAMVLDSRGTPVWYQATGTGACLVEWLADNILAYSPLLGAAFGTNPVGKYTVLDLANAATAAVQSVGSPVDQHELLPLGAGRYMVLTYPQLDGVDLSARGIATTTIMDCVAQELNADGTLAWEWRASDHIDPVVESSELATSKVAGKAVVDVFHCNSLAVNENGDVLLSVRHTDSLFLISHATGQIIWKLGGTPQNKDSAPFIALTGDPEGGFFHQHFARFLASGNISIFDNHSNNAGPARGLEMALDVTAGVANLVAEFTGVSNSAAMGSFQTLPDGTRVVGWGILTAGAVKPAMTEFDAMGNTLRSFVFAANDIPYRVMKVPTTALNLELLRAGAGKPGL